VSQAVDQKIFNCYNTGIEKEIAMNFKPVQFTVPAPPARAHRALFDRDLPFWGRREQSRIQYQRRPKHKAKEFE
jgi:hypothetical protein